MPAIVTIEKAVTGEEQLADVRDPLHALSEFYRALNSRDLKLMEENWDASDESAMDGSYHFEFHDYTLHRFNEVFYVVGRERGFVEKQGKRLEMKIRTTRVFRFDGQRWRQIHHHGSIDDAQLLAAYQAAVKRR
jgi:hypothetical protein